MSQKVINQFTDRYRFLSNFAWHDGWTVEHHFQAAKTTDPVMVAKILKAETPHEAKKLGRSVQLRPTWDSEKLTVMRTLLRLKFDFEPMAQRLIQTGDAYLIEGNTWGDQYWGVCDGQGLNNLGLLLMETRLVLQAGRSLP